MVVSKENKIRNTKDGFLRLPRTENGARNNEGRIDSRFRGNDIGKQ